MIVLNSLPHRQAPGVDASETSTRVLRFHGAIEGGCIMYEAFRRLLLGCLIIAVAGSSSAIGSILYVDQNALAGEATGVDWCNAYLELQSALSAAAASSGQATEIRVAAGAPRVPLDVGQKPAPSRLAPHRTPGRLMKNIDWRLGAQRLALRQNVASSLFRRQMQPNRWLGVQGVPSDGREHGTDTPFLNDCGWSCG